MRYLKKTRRKKMTTKFLQQALRRTKAKKQNGFTLIELMVVIAIVGVLSAVGLPELLKAQDSAKESAALQEVVAAAKTCSIDVLTGGTAYADAIGDDTWTYVNSVASACDVTGATASTITSAGPANTHTIVITSGVPSKPDTTATSSTP